MPTDHEIREALLAFVDAEVRRNGPGANLQTGSMLIAVGEQFGAQRDPEIGRALRDQVHELFRTGYFAWGHNLDNPNQPFFHLTGRGSRALERLSRDPGNPTGYLAHLAANVLLNPIAESYLREGLACYLAENFKACAVLTGAAAESLVHELRDLVSQKMIAAGGTAPKDMVDWRVSRVLPALDGYFQRSGGAMPPHCAKPWEPTGPACSSSSGSPETTQAIPRVSNLSP